MSKSGRNVKTKNFITKTQEENHKASLVDALAEFEDFKTNLLPAIQQDLKAGLSAEALRKKYLAIVQARVITNALIETDTGKSTAAAKDIIDREEGKAKDRQEVTHRLEKLPEEQLDSLLLSKLHEAGLDDEDQGLPN